MFGLIPEGNHSVMVWEFWKHIDCLNILGEPAFLGRRD